MEGASQCLQCLTPLESCTPNQAEPDDFLTHRVKNISALLNACQDSFGLDGQYIITLLWHFYHPLRWTEAKGALWILFILLLFVFLMLVSSRLIPNFFFIPISFPLWQKVFEKIKI